MLRALLSCSLLVILSACGGGGGGGGGSIPEVGFTAFSAVQPNTTQVMSNGNSRTVTGTHTGTLPNITVQTVNPPVEDTGAGDTIKLTYDASKALSRMAFSTPSGGASFGRSADSQFICDKGVCAAQTSTGTAVVIDGTSSPAGWNYQTFGVWGQTTSSTTFQAGAISAGVVTPGSAVPTLGTAAFSGVANGFFIENVGGVPGVPSLMTASMAANVNFETRVIGFSTTGSRQIPLNGGPSFSRPALDMAGNWSYAAGSNTFSGAVATTGNGMIGTASGRFYGPAAEEIGGTFSLSGTDGALVGGFGGRRP